MVFKNKNTMNLSESIPAKGASLGSKGRGPVKKNFVMPKELAKRLIKKLDTDRGSVFKLLPKPSFG